MPAFAKFSHLEITTSHQSSLCSRLTNLPIPQSVKLSQFSGVRISSVKRTVSLNSTDQIISMAGGHLIPWAGPINCFETWVYVVNLLNFFTYSTRLTLNEQMLFPDMFRLSSFVWASSPWPFIKNKWVEKRGFNLPLFEQNWYMHTRACILFTMLLSISILRECP